MRWLRSVRVSPARLRCVLTGGRQREIAHRRTKEAQEAVWLRRQRLERCSPPSRIAHSHQKLKKSRDRFSPGASRGSVNLPTKFQISGLQNWERIDFCYLWQFLKADPEKEYRISKQNEHLEASLGISSISPRWERQNNDVQALMLNKLGPHCVSTTLWFWTAHSQAFSHLLEECVWSKKDHQPNQQNSHKRRAGFDSSSGHGVEVAQTEVMKTANVCQMLWKALCVHYSLNAYNKAMM